MNDRVAMAAGYSHIGLLINIQGNHDQALDFHKKALATHEELQDRVGMAKDYANIGGVFIIIGGGNQAIESLSKGLEILQELEEKTGYHDPLSDSTQELLSLLSHEKESGNSELQEFNLEKYLRS